MSLHVVLLWPGLTFWYSLNRHEISWNLLLACSTCICCFHIRRSTTPHIMFPLSWQRIKITASPQINLYYKYLQILNTRILWAKNEQIHDVHGDPQAAERELSCRSLLRTKPGLALGTRAVVVRILVVFGDELHFLSEILGGQSFLRAQSWLGRGCEYCGSTTTAPRLTKWKGAPFCL